MSSPITPQTVQDGDRVVAMKDLHWTGLGSQGIPDFTLKAGELGTVIGVPGMYGLGTINIRWDNAPILAYERQYTHCEMYMPEVIPGGWDIQRE